MAGRKPPAKRTGRKPAAKTTVHRTRKNPDGSQQYIRGKTESEKRATIKAADSDAWRRYTKGKPGKRSDNRKASKKIGKARKAQFQRYISSMK